MSGVKIVAEGQLTIESQLAIPPDVLQDIARKHQRMIRPYLLGRRPNRGVLAP